MEMEIREKQRLVEHLTSLQMLLLHDDLWTDAVESESRSSEPSIQVVREIGEQMDALIGRAAEAGAYLKSVFAANERAVIEVGDKLGASDRLSPDQREGWSRLVQRAPNAAQLGV